MHRCKAIYAGSEPVIELFRLALVILWVNILGDFFNALIRHDLRTLIGLPIGGAMIFYLIRSRKKPAISN